MASRLAADGLLLLAVLTLMSTGAGAATTLYVATSGNDEWSGRQRSLSADRGDGPFRTPHVARHSGSCVSIAEGSGKYNAVGRSRRPEAIRSYRGLHCI